MANGHTADSVAATKKLRLIQRRAGLRLPANPASFYPPTGGRRADLWWEAMVSELVTTGVSLVASRRFEAGTLLTAELHNSAQDVSRTLLARVAHVEARANGGWLIGCSFATPLSDEELRELQ